MSWVEIAIESPAEHTDVLADYLAGYGYQGVSIEQIGILPDKWDEGDIPAPQRHTIRAYMPVAQWTEEQRNRLDLDLARWDVQPLYQTVHEEDWAEAWKAHYHTLRIGERIVIRPAWETAELRPNDIEIVLDPGMAFGTGTHPTTQLCLEAVETHMPTGASVVDLGCGSGILSIAAAKLGAGEIFAADIDPIATQSATENIAANGVATQITVMTGGLDVVHQRGKGYDVAFVNILARIIIEMCDHQLGTIVRPGGTMILSGVIETQLDDVKVALRKTGLATLETKQMGDWIRIIAQRPA